MWKFVVYYNDGSNRQETFFCEHRAKAKVRDLNMVPHNTPSRYEVIPA